MNEIIIRTIPLPCSIRAFTISDSQGDFNVYINCLLSAEQQKSSYKHEYNHIVNGDFYKDLPASIIENLRNKNS